jgi:hypothetical protein
VGPYLDAEQVYLVGQQDPAAGRYDEQKAMVGFRNAAEADAVYRAHRTDPDASLVDIQALDVEQFLRWVGVATPREPSEPVGALPAPKFTIPLEKSELVSLSGGLAPWAISTTAGAHAPGPNSAVNFVFPVPQRTPAPKPEWDDMHPSPRQVVEGGKRKRRAVKRDKRVYDFDYPLESVAKPIVIPDTFIDFSTLDPEQAEKRKQMVIREGLRYQTRRPQNKVDVE